MPALALTTNIVAACAHITPRDNPPDLTFYSSAGLDEATACIIRQFDRMVPDYGHFAAVIVPGQIYEVRPGRELTISAEIYFARIAREPDGRAKVEIFAISTWAGKVKNYASPCKS